MNSALLDSLTVLDQRLVDYQPQFRVSGMVRRVVAQSIEVSGCPLGIGERCSIRVQGRDIAAQVVGVADARTFLQPFEDVDGLRVGAKVTASRVVQGPRLDALQGRIVDGLGHPLDGRPLTLTNTPVEARAGHINPMDRGPIRDVLDVGVRSVNALLTIGIGQRVGLFAGSGVGKSVLLGMMARYTRADVVVVGLIGERGREVREFVEESLSEGLAHSVVVASPADDAPVLRIRAAFLATEIAEAYRAQGKHVLLLLDSLTRVAQAQREVGLAAGEPPTTKGYTPSVFRLLPQLVERAGNLEQGGGSITALYTVLTEEDDLQEPVADAARAILDGHFVLSRGLADAGIFPAIDINSSISRLMPNLVDDEQRNAARLFNQLSSRYAQQEDLINVGAYVRGSDSITDRAIELHQRMEEFLTQDLHQQVNITSARAELLTLMEPPSQPPIPIAGGNLANNDLANENQ